MTDKPNDLICAAVCVCCAETGGQAYDGLLLVMDLDACRAGLLRCGEDESIALLWEAEAPFDAPGTFDKEMKKLCGAGARALSDNRKEAARRYRRYYENRREEDIPAFAAVNCAQLDEAFGRIRSAYQALFDETGRRLQDGAPEKYKLLTIGSMADIFLSEYCVRERFSTDPLKSDPLFWTLDEGVSRAQLAEKGRKLLEAREAEKLRCLEKTVALCLLDQNGQEEEIVLARADQLLTELAEPRFTPPFLYLREEALTWRIDGALRQAKAPRTLLPLNAEAGLISAALVFRDGSARILLRNEKNRALTAEMALPQADDAVEG